MRLRQGLHNSQIWPTHWFVMHGHVLIVGRDAATCDLLRIALGHDGFAVDVAADLATALAHSQDYDVVLADVELAALAPVKARSPATEVVLMTGTTALDAAMGAVAEGAFDFVMRPFFVEDVSLTVACAAARRRRGFPLNTLSFVGRNCELTR